MDAVSQGDVWAEKSVDGGPWARLVRARSFQDVLGQGDVWAVGSVGGGKSL